MLPLGAAAVLLAAAACTEGTTTLSGPGPGWIRTAQLTTYDSCDAALEGIQDAVIDTLTDQYRARAALRGSERFATGGDSAGAEEADGVSDSSASYSETNVAVAGVDEPDLVKTNGERIYTITEGRLRVVDAADAKVIAEADYNRDKWGHQLFLGDDELLLMYSEDHEIRDRGEYWGHVSEFVLERLDTESLAVLDEFRFEGRMVDARLVDGQARFALASHPYLYPLMEGVDHNDPIPGMRDAIRSTDIETWLPAYSVNGSAAYPGCDDIAHPERFTGDSTLTVFAVPIDGGWSGVEPLTIMADGDTVHGTAESLYVTHSAHWWGSDEPASKTEIYRFGFDGDNPRLAGEAAVAGTLLNQYSMSEHDGHLRVATTEGQNMWWGWDVVEDTAEPDPSSSTVTVLRIDDDALTEVGSVGELGVTERIYAVRFMGDTGYVVTFRQTDPLYTLDLSDPANPRVTGELKITGYSAYLHPVGPDRLIGVGQEATEEGRTIGLQVSLFDVSGDEATVLSQYLREGAGSEAEWDPRGFLYWEPESVVVLPVWQWDDRTARSLTGAAVLRVDDRSITEVAFVTHQGGEIDYADEDDRWMDEWNRQVVRTLVIDDRLWTVSNVGLKASDLADFSTSAWIEW